MLALHQQKVLLVLNLGAPKILQRPAPQQGAQLFGAPRPKHPSPPANPDDKQALLLSAAFKSPQARLRSAPFPAAPATSGFVVEPSCCPTRPSCQTVLEV